MTETITKIEQILQEGTYVIDDHGIIVNGVVVHAEIVQFIQK